MRDMDKLDMALLTHLNDTDIRFVASTCDQTGMELIIEDGKVTDFILKEES